MGAVLALGLALRLWGVDHGLPFVFNIDERAHFVPRAVGMYGGDLNPGDFLNPGGFIYLLYAALAVWFGGPEGAAAAYATDPTAAFLVGRVLSVLIGTAAVGLVYLAGARLLDRRVGLLGAGLLAVAFLPAFYSRQAVNDVPAMAAVSLGLLGAAQILRRGRLLDYGLAGLGLGLAAATKYTGAIVALPVLLAALVHLRGAPRRTVAGVGLALGLAGLIFLVLNPYAVLDSETFLRDLRAQSDYNSRGLLLGERQDSGVLYYLWTLTWGLGWVPALAAVGGAAVIARRDVRAALLLVLPPLVFLVFMGVHGRYFGRYLLPAFPFFCLLAAVGAGWFVSFAGRFRPRLAPVAAVVAVVALCGQGLVHSVHSSLVDTRTDTRTLARSWMVENVPPGTPIVQEPIVPREWLHDGGRPAGEDRWERFRRSPALVRRLERQFPGAGQKSDFQNYVRTLFPGLIDFYERTGQCWVVSGSTQSGRALLQPERVPGAVAYYRELARRGRVAFRSSPTGAPETGRPFQFDMSFNTYELDRVRPGPTVTIHRLAGGRCAAERSA